MGLVDLKIYDCFLDRVKKSPEEVFIEHYGEQFTWKNVNKITYVLSNLMIEQGIRKGDRVGIYGINSASWIITFLALQRIGAVSVLINSCYKESELKNCIEIADIRFLFYIGNGKNYDDIISGLKRKHELKDMRFYNIEHSYSEWMKIADRIEEMDLSSEDEKMPSTSNKGAKELSCILFTSGTTNNCKGVKLSHFSLVNNALQVTKEMRWSDKDTMCLAVPLFHCFGVTVSLLASIIAGMKISLLDKYKTVEVCESIERMRCTVLNGVPSMFLAMIKNPDFKKYDLSSLKSGIIAGSPIFKKDYFDICNSLEGVRLQTSYGLTEASPCVSISGYEDSIELKSKSAGRVIDNVEVRIIDQNTGKICGENEIGEIFVSGYNITQGYLSNDPVICDAVGEDGWLKTGDLGYLDKNKYLYIVGRRKNLIIRGGENISPQEIEQFIKEVVPKNDVYVFGKKSEVLQEEIVACIEAKEDYRLESEIKDFMKKNVSRYKMPSDFVFVETFPRTVTGKIDEKNLKLIAEERLKQG